MAKEWRSISPNPRRPPRWRRTNTAESGELFSSDKPPAEFHAEIPAREDVGVTLADLTDRYGKQQFNLNAVEFKV